jgi:hypothetical protein
MKRICLGLCCVLLTAFQLTAVGAEQKPSAGGAGTKPEAANKAKGMPFYGKVGTIDKAAGTLTLDGKEKKRLFYLTSSTRIHRDKQPAKLEEVAVGQWVGGFVRPDAGGRPMVETLNLAVVQRSSPGSSATNVVKKPLPAGKQGKQ